MINRFIQYRRGYLRVKAVSCEPERFLNLCAHNQIELWNLVHENSEYIFNIRIKDFFKLKQFHLKTKTRIRILERHGLPFFFQKNKKRKAFFLGFAMFAFMIYILSLHIWNIHVEGNTYYSTRRILMYLEEQDINHGIRKKQLDCAGIAAGIRQEFPKITWVSAKIQGTQLIVEIKENDEPLVQPDESPKENVISDEQPCDITAGKDGKILKIFTRSGKPLIQEQAECKKGDILVSGKVEILNDSKEVVRTEYVHADADIYMETHYSYYDEFPMEYQERIYTGEEKTTAFFKLFQYYINLGREKQPFEFYDQYSQEKQVYLTENFVLPISYGTLTTLPYEIKNKKYTKEEATEKANNKIFIFLKNLSAKGVEIRRKNVKIDTTGSICKVTGKIYVVEKATVDTPITPEIPETDPTTEERTLTDE